MFVTYNLLALIDAIPQRQSRIDLYKRARVFFSHQLIFVAYFTEM